MPATTPDGLIGRGLATIPPAGVYRRSSNLAPPAWAPPAERPQQDSNLRTRLRRPLLYPLSYGGSVTDKATSAEHLRTRCRSARIAAPEAIASRG
jgi:hypothetical protein